MGDTFTQGWNKAYNQSIISFTGRNKLEIDELQPLLKQTGPLVDVLSELDLHQNKLASPESKKKYEAAGKNLKKETANFRKKLVAAQKVVSKNDHPTVHRDLKTLDKQLDFMLLAVESTLEASSKGVVKDQEQLRGAIKKQREQLTKANAPDEEVKKQNNFGTKLLLLAQFPSSAKKVVAQAKVAISRVKSDPTPKTYNELFSGNGVGRGMSQVFLNVIKVIQDPKCPQSLKTELAGMAQFEDDLSAFGGTDLRDAPLTATANEVLARNTRFKQMVEGLEPYMAKVVNFLAKRKKELIK